MKYLQKNKKLFMAILFLAASYHLYFIFLLKDQHIQKLLYLDTLLLVLFSIFFGIDACQYYSWKKQKESLLPQDYVICRELGPVENIDIAIHDTAVLEEQLQEQYRLNCDLQDYIAKWCHEVKIPLSASLLMNEKILDAPLRTSQKQQLERIQQQLNGALLGCKVQSRLFDIQIRAVDLADCVKTAIHNNQYFLIQNQFEIQLDLKPVRIYTDPSWFVYVLDQLIQNAIKYSTNDPVLIIRAVPAKDDLSLIIEDHGEGILDCDIRRIFERGFTGSSHHNGKYKSTGMGLYMAAQILEKLEHEISVESVHGSYTRFIIHIKCPRPFD